MEPNVNCAIKKGYFQQVRFLLELSSSPNCRDEERMTPLMNCALVEDEAWGVGLARTLIEKGAVMSFKCCRGMNILHYACIYGRIELMQVFLGSADFNIIQADEQGNTSLHYAAAKGHQSMVTTLVDTMRQYHLGMDSVNMLGFTALMLAWRGGHELSARVLLSRGADTKPRDYVEQKTADDYEEQCRKQRDTRQRSGRYTKRYSNNLPQYQTSLSSGNAALRKRSASANGIDRLRVARGQHTQDDEEDYVQREEKDRSAGRLIHSASHSNPRNRPEQLLSLPPTDYFVKETRFQTQHQHPSSISLYSGGRNTHNRIRKSEITNMYTAFQFQFSDSYCRPVRPKEAVGSASGEYGGEAAPEGAEKSRRQRKASGKISQGNDDKLEKKSRKSSWKSLSRKISNMSTVSMSSQKSDQGVLDGNESVNNSLKNTKKRIPKETIEPSELNTNTKADKNGMLRSRKLSAAIENHLDMIRDSSKSSLLA